MLAIQIKLNKKFIIHYFPDFIEKFKILIFRNIKTKHKIIKIINKFIQKKIFQKLLIKIKKYKNNIN